LFPPIEPYDAGLLPVGNGDRLYWEQCGNPNGRPVLVLHGGPGSGCTPWHRRLFDPSRFRIVLFDQRNCGRSTPHASQPHVDLTGNTTQNLVSDIEVLRTHMGVEEWLVWGGSWGSTLALAYAEAQPARTTGILLWGVSTGRHCEFDWLFRGGVAIFFPKQWDRLRAGLPPAEQDADIVDHYRRLLWDPDPVVHHQAAEAWCRWESATVTWPPSDELSPRFRDRSYALAFARIVTHYVAANAWLDDGTLIRGADALSGIRGIIVQSRSDFQSPIGNAWALHRVWPRSELLVVENAGHDPQAPEMIRALVAAGNKFADG
jgi:proline iminopeptidase